MKQSLRFISLFALLGTLVMNSISAFSQNEKTIDSLKNIFQNTEEDTVKIDLLLKTGDACVTLSLDSSLTYYEKAGAIALNIKNNKLLAICYDDIAFVYYYKGIFNKALEYYLKSLKINEEENNKTGMAACYNNIGNIFYNQFLYDKAIFYYSKSLSIYEETGDKNPLAKCNGNMGGVYLDKKMFSQSLQYFLKALKLFTETDNKVGMASCYNDIAGVFYGQEDYTNAVEYLLKSLNLKESLGDRQGMAKVLSNMSSLYIQMRSYKEAVASAEKSLSIADSLGALQLQCENYEHISAAYDSLLDYKNALKYHRLFKEMKDSIVNKESNEQFAELQTKYETEKKEAQIEKLTGEKELQELKLKQNKIIIYSISFGAVLLLIVILSIFNIYKQKQTRRKMFGKIIETEEKERKRFAEDLHDWLGPLLSSVSLYVNELKSDRHQQNEKDEFLKYTNDLIDEAIKNTRSIANNLMPGILNDYGLVTAVDTFCIKLKKSGSINISLLSDKKDQRYHPAIEITLYRVILEMINNTIKHAHATNISIDINDNDKMISVKYEDDGRGFDLERIMHDPKKGMGLNNIQNRVKSIGGSCTMVSEDGKGMQCFINVNYKKYIS
jgi:two-component system, NarL family, sensor kinase